MRSGSFVLLACCAMLSAGCGSDATNRSATSTDRTVNKPIVEDRTRDAQPTGGDRSLTNPTPGTVIQDRIPTPNQPNTGADPGSSSTSPATTPPSDAAPGANNTTPATDPAAAPKSETTPPIIP